MEKRGILDQFNSLLRNQQPELSLGVLQDSIYSKALTPEERQNCLQVIEFARNLQFNDPTYEALYHHLLHLFILNGSRLDLVRKVDRRLRGLAKGQGALILVGGESGIGKTSMVMAFQERFTQLGVRFISGRCSDQEQGAYAIWQEITRSASSAGLSLDTLPPPFGRGKAARSSHHLKRIMTDWLQSCAASQPMVILLDDLHWSDVDSLELLDALTQPTPGPILFIATYRSEETHLKSVFYDDLPKLMRNRRVDLLELNALTGSDVERFATAYHGACTPELADYLYERAEGHPLFTVGLFEDLIAQSLLNKDQEGRWQPPSHSVSIPVVLKQLITQRVSRLGVQAERLLLIGAVAGESWSLKIIEPLVEMPEEHLMDAVVSALQAEIIHVKDEQGEIYSFSHGLMREVLYTNQLVRRRRLIHQQIAAQLERQQPQNTAAIAHHYLEGEQWPKAVEYCLAAGEQAVQRFAFHSALQWYQQGLNASERGGDALSPKVPLTIYDHLGRTYRALEKPQEAEIIYARMRDFAQSSGDLVAEGLALVNLATTRVVQYQFDLAERTAYEALKIGELTNDARLMAQTHGCLGGLFIYRGQLEKVTYHLNEAQSRLQMLGDVTFESEVSKYRSYLAIWTGQFHDAETDAQNILDLARVSVDPLIKLSGYQNLSWAQIERGKYKSAYENILTIIKAGEVTEARHHILPRLLNLMGYLHLELGDPQTALEWDQQALSASWIDSLQGNYEMRRYSLLNMATDYLYLGKLEIAQEVIAQFEAFKEAGESVRYRYYNRYQLLMSEMSLVQREYPQAIEWAQEARCLAETNGILKNIAKSHWFEGQALAGLRQYDEAEEQIYKGISIADDIRHGSLRWKIRLSLTEVMWMAGRSKTEVIRQAREMVDQIIKSLSGSSLQEIFLASQWMKQLEKFEQNRPPQEPAYPAGLTRREVEVLKLVARGATNQEVADILHISARTVNTHMTNILNKLGLDNRTAASVFAIQHKLA